MILNVCPNPSIDTYAWLEDLQPGHSNRITKLVEFPGGKATHIAMALQELGQSNTLMANWAGNTGAWIKEQCATGGIRISGISIEGQNRKCYTFRSDNPAFANTELLEPGPVFNSNHWNEFKSVFEKEIKNHELICISGSWPKGASNTATKELVDFVSKAGKKVIIDCSGEQLKKSLTTSFFGIHLNEHEASELLGTDSVDKSIAILRQKAELIAITKGAEGLWLYYKDELFHANVHLDQVISTVGAGDCLTAGIAYAVYHDFSPERTAAYGAACGAANCLHEELGALEKQTVERLLEKVVVKKIKLNTTNYAD